MKIYGSTQYVSAEDEPIQWYSLSVINMLDFKTKLVCFQNIQGNIIGYALKLNRRNADKSYSSENITNLSDEMRSELINMGYTVI